MADVERLDLSDPLSRSFDVVANTLRPMNLVGDVIRHPLAYAARWGAIAFPFVAPGATMDLVDKAVEIGQAYGPLFE